MTGLTRNHIRGGEANQHATSEEFCRIFTEDLSGLYQLSFLLTGDHEKAEHCCVAGLEDCARTNHVFRDWARSWAKRTIIQNAIRELKPRPRGAKSSFSDTAFPNFCEFFRGQDGHYELKAVLALEDFERFVFVMSVLEHYSVHECALLLGCSQREVQEGQTRAFSGLVDSSRMVFSRQNSFGNVQETNR